MHCYAHIGEIHLENKEYKKGENNLAFFLMIRVINSIQIKIGYYT